ncbi:hypothetical protein HK105_208173 [Polyrhizophydium stewartii]|uniref:RNase H type-1 domain-containing protein n=3 Tax=Polyrhizophydium stewartii TaxID=2732419 RepID=A0ABR4MYH4_9FUNG
MIGLSETWVSSQPSPIEAFLRSLRASSPDLHYHLFDDRRDDPSGVRGLGTAILVHHRWVPFIGAVERIPGLLTGICLNRHHANQKIWFICVYNPHDKPGRDLVTAKINAIRNSLGPHDLLTSHSRRERNLPAIMDHPDPLTPFRTLTDTFRFLHPNELAFTHHQPNPLTHSRIDLVLQNGAALRRTHSIDILDPLAARLHHNLIRFPMSLPVDTVDARFESPSPPPPRIYWHAANDSQRAAFIDRLANHRFLTERLEHHLADGLNVDEICDRFMSVIHSCALRTLPTTRLTSQGHLPNQSSSSRHPLAATWSHAQSVFKGLRKRPSESSAAAKKIIEKWVKDNPPANFASLPIHTQLKIAIHRITSESKRRAAIKRKEQNRISLQHARTNLGRLIRANASPLRNDAAIDHVLVNGIVRNDRDSVLSTINNFWQPIFTASPDPKPVNTLLDSLPLEHAAAELTESYPSAPPSPDTALENPLISHAYLPLDNVNPLWYAGICDPASTQEISAILHNAPNRKAPGHYAVPYELLKALPATTASKVILLPKDPQFNGDISRTRPISLLEPFRKLVEAVLTKRLTKVIDSHPILVGHNFGFRTGLSTNDAVHATRHIIDIAKLSCIAYADDLQPFAESPQDLQAQLNIISSFLTANQMRMNPEKCAILTNLPQTDLAASPLNIQINGSVIPTERPGDHMSRILGVFSTFDGSHTQTINHAISEAKKLLGTLCSRHTPGPLGITILNSVVIPRLLYRLQTTPLSSTNYNSIDNLIRSHARHKLSLPTDSHSSLIHDRRLNTALTNFSDAHKRSTITDALIKVRSHSNTGFIFIQSVAAISSLRKAPVNLLECPLPLHRFHSSPFISFISHLLHEENMSFRIPTQPLDRPIHHIVPAHLLPPDAATRKEILPLTARHFLDPAEPMQTSSYARFASQYATGSQSVAAWFKHIVAFLSCAPPASLDLSPNTRLAVHPSILSCPPPTIIDAPRLLAWTDGSLEDGEMGSAAVICLPPHNPDLDIASLADSSTLPIIAQLQVKPPPGFPSSTKAEIFAILHTVRHCAPGCHLTVFTDSQAAIDAIKKSTNLVSERNLLKLSCHGMLSAIHEITTMQHINIDLVKVKGHSGIPMNELADSLAKDARALPASHHDPLLQVNDDYLLDLCHMETLLHQDSIPIEIYPSKLLKSVPYAQWSTATNATLAKHNPGIPTANWDLTLRLINIGCGKIDHLDSSHTNETAFRLRLLTGRLQTNARIHGFGTLPDAKCPRCPCPSETRDHFLACPANVALLPRIVARTRELLVSRMSSARHWSPLTSIRNVPAGLLKALMLTRPNCLSSPTAKGIITSQLVNRVSRKLKAKLPLQTRRLAAMYAADCLLTAVYETAIAQLASAGAAPLGMRERRIIPARKAGQSPLDARTDTTTDRASLEWLDAVVWTFASPLVDQATAAFFRSPAGGGWPVAAVQERTPAFPLPVRGTIHRWVELLS